MDEVYITYLNQQTASTIEAALASIETIKANLVEEIPIYQLIKKKQEQLTATESSLPQSII